MDANILIRAVLGRRVRPILEAYANSTSFVVPEVLITMPNAIFETFSRGAEQSLESLRTMASLVTIVGPDVYGLFKGEATSRIGATDPADWPILATALAFDCPIWAEDRDFFGCGVATWTSSRIGRFLGQ